MDKAGVILCLFCIANENLVTQNLHGVFVWDCVQLWINLFLQLDIPDRSTISRNFPVKIFYMKDVTITSDFPLKDQS